MSQTGTVRSYNGAKGFGFIVCENAPGDIYFAKNDLPQDASDVQGKYMQGRLMTFDTLEQPDGKLKVANLLIVPVEGLPVPGVVKGFSEKNGYGFLTSTLLTEDVRFQREDVPQNAPGGVLVPGNKMTFDVLARPDGKLLGKNLRFQMDPTKNPMAAMGGTNAMGNNMMGNNMMGNNMMNNGMVGNTMNRQQPQMASSGARPGDQGTDLGIMEGTVKSFSERNGYGFISAPGHNQDIKFGKNNLGGLDSLPKGTSVTFNAYCMQDGRIQARDVIPAHGGFKRFAEAEGEDEPAAKKTALAGYI